MKDIIAVGAKLMTVHENYTWFHPLDYCSSFANSCRSFLCSLDFSWGLKFIPLPSY